MSLAPGALIGRFAVIRVLGSGGMGVVYEASDPDLDRRVAVKMLRPERIDHRDRLMREAQTLAQLSHPNVVHVYEVGVHDGSLFIAMELVPGRTLDEVLADAALPWPAVVAIFLQAGRGLEAAHRRGIVHRDFKPQNVMIDRDGRARVTDFGLARAIVSNAEGARTFPSPPETSLDATLGSEAGEVGLLATTPAAASPGLDPLAVPLTGAGAILGTPRYMAPEQHDGQAATARSDQYSFCLALWEAVHRAYPFETTTMAALAAAKRAGCVAPGARGPGWLVRALRRGLAPDPAARYPSLSALLGVLERTPQRRRRLLVAGAAACVLGAAVAITAAVRGREDPAARCAGVTARVAAVWNGERAAAARAAVLATAAPYAERAWASTRERLDGYAAEVGAMRQDACRATYARGEQSGEALDLRMVCLDRLTDGLDAVVTALAAVDGPSVDGSVRAALALPPVARCADVARLRQALPLPDDEAARTRIAQVRASLAQAGVHLLAGRPAPALTVLGAQAHEVKALAYPPLTAEQQLKLGEAQRKLGKLVDAEQAIRAAYVSAETARDDDLRADAMLELGEVLIQGDRPAEWDAMVPAADALFARAADADREARFLMNQSLMAERNGKLAEAVELGKRALAIRERSAPGNELAVGSALAHLANRLAAHGELDAAEAHARRALAIFKRIWGDVHPNTAASLLALASIAYQRQDLPAALALFEEVRAIYDKVHGPDHHRTIGAATNLSIVLNEVGRLDEARTLLEDTLRRAERVVGPDSEVVGNTLSTLGHNAYYRKDYPVALDYYRRAHEHFFRRSGAGHPGAARARIHEGSTLLDMGDARGAIAAVEEALPHLLASFGEDHEDVKNARDVLARAKASRQERRPF